MGLSRRTESNIQQGVLSTAAGLGRILGGQSTSGSVAAEMSDPGEPPTGARPKKTKAEKRRDKEEHRKKVGFEI